LFIDRSAVRRLASGQGQGEGVVVPKKGQRAGRDAPYIPLGEMIEVVVIVGAVIIRAWEFGRSKEEIPGRLLRQSQGAKPGRGGRRGFIGKLGSEGVKEFLVLAIQTGKVREIFKVRESLYLAKVVMVSKAVLRAADRAETVEVFKGQASFLRGRVSVCHDKLLIWGNYRLASGVSRLVFMSEVKVTGVPAQIGIDGLFILVYIVIKEAEPEVKVRLWAWHLGRGNC
jgi:hypothetical protein